MKSSSLTMKDFFINSHFSHIIVGHPCLLALGPAGLVLSAMLQLFLFELFWVFFFIEKHIEFNLFI